MAGSYTAGSATVDIIPSMRGFFTKLQAELKKAQPEVEVTATVDRVQRQVTQATAKIAKNTQISVPVEVDASSLAKAKRAVQDAEKSLASARDNATDATARARIAETALNETRGKAGAKQSQIAAAELRVAQARRAATSAANDQSTAEGRVAAARREYAASSLDQRRQVTATVDVDTGGAVTKLQALFSFFRGRQVTANVDADTGAATSKLAGFAVVAKRLVSVTGNVSLDTGAAIAKIATLNFLMDQQVAKWTALGLAGIAAFAGIGAAAVAIPGVLAAIFGPIAALIVAFQGIFDAFGAFSDAEKNSAATSAAAAQKQVQSARQIASAKQQQARAAVAVQRAEQDAEWAAESAAQRVAAAERDVDNAQLARLQSNRDLLSAQKNLTAATRDARAANDDLNFSIRDGAQSEAEAAFAKKQATKDLADARAAAEADPGGQAALDNLEQANLAYNRSVLSLERVQRQNAKLADERKTADAVGIAGSQQVVAAEEQVAQATERTRQADEAYGVAKEQRDQAQQARTQQQIQSERSVSDALAAEEQAALQASQAVADSQAQLAAGQDKVAQAMAALTPNAAATVLAVQALKPALTDVKNSVQEAFFAGMGPALTQFADATLPSIKDNLTGIAAAANIGARSFLAFASAPPIVAQINSLFTGIQGLMIQSVPVLIKFAQLFLQLANAALPGLTAIVNALGTVATAVMTAMQPLIDSGVFTAALQGIALVIQAVGPLLATLLSVAVQLMAVFGPVIAQIAVALTPVIQQLGAVFAVLLPPIGQLIGMLVSALAPILAALIPVFNALAPIILSLVNSALAVLVPLIQVAAQVFMALMPAIKMVADVTAQLVPQIMPLITSLITGLLPVVKEVAAVFATTFVAVIRALLPVLPSLVNAVVVLAQALLPLVPVLAQIVIAFVSGLMPVLPPLFAAFMQLVSALAPILPILGQLVLVLVQALMPIIQALVPIWITLIQAVVPLLPPLISLAMEILPVIASVLSSLTPIIKLVADLFATQLSWVLNVIVLPALQLLITIIRAVWGAFTVLWNVFKPIIDGIASSIQWVWDHAVKPVFGWFQDATKAVSDAFVKMGDKIGGIWDGVRKLVHDGIQGVIDFFWNDGLRPVVNGIIKFIPGATELQPYMLPAFAEGGIVPGGYKPGQDTVVARLSPGEGILVPEAVSLIGGPSVLEAINRRAMGVSGRVTAAAGGNRFAAGGVVATPATGAGNGPAGGDAAVSISGDPTALTALGSSADATTGSVTALAAAVSSLLTPTVEAVTAAVLALTTAITVTVIPTLVLLGARNVLLGLSFQQLAATVMVVWQQITTAIVTAAGTLWARQLLLQTQYAGSWGAITTAVTSSTTAQSGALSVLVGGLVNLRSALTNTADWATTQWNRMRAAAADPVRWVLEQPFNAGIIAAWNQLNSDFGLNKPVAPVAIPFATGGRVPGVGNKDSVKAYLTPGEYVLSRPAIEHMGGLAAVDRMHQAARAGVLGPEQRLGRTKADGAQRMRLMKTVPLDGLAFAYGGVQPQTALAGDEITKQFGPMPGGIGGVGNRPNVSDHPLGLALDFMVLSDSALGDRVAGYLQANAARMLVKYLIWKQRINSGDGWKAMEDRGSVTANHFDHVHASFLGSGAAGRAFSGDGAMLDPAGVVEQAFQAAMGLANQTGGKWPGNTMALYAGAIALKTAEQVKAKAVERLNAAMSVGAAGGSGVERWRPVVLQALGMLGLPASDADRTLRRMNQESGGNPKAINNWDSNARRGTPSKGLMQVIDPTFDSNWDPRTPHDVWNPLSNIVASMRYAVRTYGSLAAAYDKAGGYRFGGVIPGVGGIDSRMIRATPGERVLTPAQNRDFEALVARIGSSDFTSDPDSRAATRGGDTYNVYPAPGMDEQSLALSVSRRTAQAQRNL